MRLSKPLTIMPLASRKPPMKRKIIGLAKLANALPAGATPGVTHNVGPSSDVTGNGHRLGNPPYRHQRHDGQQMMGNGRKGIDGDKPQGCSHHRAKYSPDDTALVVDRFTIYFHVLGFCPANVRLFTIRENFATVFSFQVSLEVQIRSATGVYKWGHPAIAGCPQYHNSECLYFATCV